MNHFDLVVIGGGAGGIFSAISAAQTNKKISILIIEKLNRIGKKIIVSGNGRCNLSNMGEYIYYGEVDFARKTLGDNASHFILDSFNKMGLATIVDMENRVYPASNSASSVMDIFLLNLKINNIEVKTDCEVFDIDKSNNLFTVKTNLGKIFAKKIIVSTGGKSSPKHGSDGKLFKILNGLGINSTDFRPALVPICTNTDVIKGLSGLRIRAELSVNNEKAKGEILFTDYGLSGIPAMQISRFCNKGDIINIDLRYGAAIENKNKNEIINIIKERIVCFPNETVDTLLMGMFVNRISLSILKNAGISPLTLKNFEINENQIEKIASIITSFKLKVKDTKGFEFSQVTAGGLICSQFNPITMESYKIKGLYCVGEILNVDGDCGGFNLLFAFKTGYNAGVNAAKSLIL